MNVLFICDEYPPGKNGGIGTVVQVLGRELVRQGNNVFVVGLYSYSYGQKDYELDNGVKIWRLRYGLNFGVGNDLIYKIINKLNGKIKSALNGQKAFNGLINFIDELINSENIDVIEIPDWNTFAMKIGLEVKWPKFKVPLIVKSHGSYTKITHELGVTAKPGLLKIDALLYKRADALAAVSLNTAEINKKLFKTDKLIKTLYNGIDLPVRAAGIERKKETVVFTGTLIKAKGIFQLLKAWNLVHIKHPGAELDIYGKGDIKSLKKMLSPLALHTVKFKGHVNRTVLFEVLSRATIAVFPSYSESFALAPMEAMALGCPVIYTNRSSGSELITNGENGVLIDPDNVEEIANNITGLLENDSLQKKYSANGFNTIRTKFDIKKVAAEHLNYYQTIIHNFKS